MRLLLCPGISRSSLPTGTKGFGGTEGFMAPEMMRHNGEEEYTEKVKDTHSFWPYCFLIIVLCKRWLTCSGYTVV